MTKKTTYILGILLTGIVGCILQYYTCCKNCDAYASKATVDSTTTTNVNSPIPTSLGFTVSDPKGGFDVNINDHFNFKGSNFEILKPISNNLSASIAKLKAYLNNNPDKTLDIIGLYKSSEKNTSAYPNLGIARAEAIKHYLVDSGISSKQLNCKDQIDDSLISNAKNIYLGPAKYRINTIDISDAAKVKTAADLKILHDKIQENPLELYFATGSSSLKLTQEQRLKMFDIATYIDKTDDAEIRVIGHTDNTGDFAKNIQLGLDRANTIKGYLIKNNIPAMQIATSSQGSKKPISTNQTEQGRAKNRRVEVTLK